MRRPSSGGGSLDARGMLEVNRDAIFQAAREAGTPSTLVVSMATWGRGCSPETLALLQPFNRVLGYNASLVATPPREIVQQALGKGWSPELDEQRQGRFPAIGVALGETVWEWWNLDGTVDGDDLF